MHQPIFLYIGFRYLFSKMKGTYIKLVFFLSITNITIGSTCIIIVLSIMNGLERKFENNIFHYIPHLIVTNFNKNINPKEIPSSIFKNYKKIIKVVPLTASEVIIQNNKNFTIANMIGVNPDDNDPIFDLLIENNPNDLISNKYFVIISETLAKKLNLNKGDLVRLIIPKITKFTPIGNFPSQRLFQVIGTFHATNEINSHQILVNKEDASRLMQYPIDNITGWKLWINNPFKIDQIVQEISISDKFIIQDWREKQGEIFDAIKMEKNMMSLFFYLISIISTFNITVFITLLIIEKRTEIMILRTQGIKFIQLLFIFLIQGIFINIIGLFLGSILGLIMLNKQNFLLLITNLITSDHIFPIPVEIKYIQIIKISFLTLFISIICTILPVIKLYSNIHYFIPLKNE